MIGGCGRNHGASGTRDGQKWRIEELFCNRNKKFSAILILSIKFLRKAFNIFYLVIQNCWYREGWPLLTVETEKNGDAKRTNERGCAAGFALLNLPKGKSLGRSKPETSSYAQALATHCVGFLLYPSSAELPYAK